MSESSSAAVAPDLARGLDPDYYLASERFTAARDRIFYQTWQLAGHVSQLRNPGDYWCFSIFDQDLFLIRQRNQDSAEDSIDGAGAIRCFYNVCQHRGHSLLEGQGQRRLITCPYHAWTYGLDGHLRGAPNSDQVRGFDRAEICLREVRLEVFCGFVFVNLADDAEAMEVCYPGVREALLACCADIETRQFVAAHSCEEQCNWLVGIENYNECYHCPVAHKSFASGVIDPASYNIQPFGSGHCLRHTAKAASGQSAWYDTSGSSYNSFFLWPAAALQIYPGGMLNTYHWRPLTATTTEVCRGWYSADPQADTALHKVMELDRTTTFAEDLELVRCVQRGLGSRGYRPGPLVLDPRGGIRSEHSVAVLHAWLRESLGASR